MLYFVLTTFTLLFAGLSATNKESIQAIIASHNELRSLLDEIATSPEATSSSSDSGSESGDGHSSRKSNRLRMRSMHSSRKSNRRSMQEKKEKYENITRELLSRLKKDESVDTAVYESAKEKYGHFIKKIKPITSQRSLNSFVKDTKSSMTKFENPLIADYLEDRYLEYWIKAKRQLSDGEDKQKSLYEDVKTINKLLSDYSDKESDPSEARAYLDEAFEKINNLDQIQELRDELLGNAPMVSGWQMAKANMLNHIEKEIRNMNLSNCTPAKLKALKATLNDVIKWDDVKEPTKYDEFLSSLKH